MAELLPISFLQKRKGPPEPPLQPGDGGSGGTLPLSIQALQKRTTEVSLTQAQQIQSQKAAALANEVSEVTTVLQSIQSQMETNSPFGIMAGSLVDVVGTMTVPGLAVFSPVVDNFWTNAQDVINMGLPETNVTSSLPSTSSQQLLFNILQDLGQQELQIMISSLVATINQKIQEDLTRHKKNDKVHASLVNGYPLLVQSLALESESIASGNSRDLVNLATMFPDPQHINIQTALGQNAAASLLRYSELSAEASSCNTIFRNDAEQSFRTGQVLQELACTVGHGSAVLDNYSSGTLLTFATSQASGSNSAAIVSSLYSSGLLSRFQIRAEQFVKSIL